MKTIALWIAAAILILIVQPARPAMNGHSSNRAVADGSHDFDFLFGRWNIHNRRLRRPLTGSSKWYEFESTSNERPLLSAEGNLEQYDAVHTATGPIHAIAVRLYNAKSHQWSIYWSTAGSGVFGVPTVGAFKDGVGTFFDREEYNSRSIVVRFIWTHNGTSSCRWEQAFSLDDGKTWEVNWIMDFRPMSAAAHIQP
jgi:hypothetical protein